ncbi:Frigida-like [Sesbania bispinosa]|nr:Frigida-like [Sesbania bispinosa]
MKLANDWKANLDEADKDCLEVLDFFKFITTYEIGSSFNASELQRLLDIIAQHCQIPQLLGNIENLPDNQSCLTTNDGRNLQLLSNESEISNDILVNLQTSSDAAKLVLDIIKNPIVPQSMKENEGLIIDESHIFLLDQLMKISPHIKPHVREEALKLALDLTPHIRASAENSLAVLGFLLLLSVYGLLSYFNKDDVFKLLELVTQHKQAVELYRTLGFVDKVSDVVQKLIEKKQRIEAVRFICAYKLTGTIEPADLLRHHIKRVQKSSFRFGRKKCAARKVKAKDMELACLETVLQCISETNLKSQDLVDEIQDRILALERHKETIRRSALEQEASSKVEEQEPEEKKPANEAVTENQVEGQQLEGKKPANEAVTENQVKGQQPEGKKLANEAVANNEVKVQQPEEKKPANGAVTMNHVKVQQPKGKKLANGAVTTNQLEEKKPANEAVTMNQVQVQQPQEKKRAIETVPNNYQLHESGNNSKRPRTAAGHSVPSVFTPQYRQAFIPNGVPPPQYRFPTNFYGPPNPLGHGQFGNTPARPIGSSFSFKCMSLTQSAAPSAFTPPLSKERMPEHFQQPMGMGYSSSGSLDHHQMQPYPCHATSGLASTPNLSTISAPKTERSSLEGSVRTSSSGEGDHPLASVQVQLASPIPWQVHQQLLQLQRLTYSAI